MISTYSFDFFGTSHKKLLLLFQDYHLYAPQFIVTHSNKTDVKATWKLLFKKAMEKFQVEVSIIYLFFDFFFRFENLTVLDQHLNIV